jgi:sterol 3beta-glucosyltransferase
MHIAILALGSRGDVQPFIALGLALRERGHSVRLLAAEDFAPLAAAYGLPFAPVGGSIDALMDRQLVYDTLDAAAARRLPLGFARRFVAQVAAYVPPLTADALAGARGADALVASTLGVVIGVHLAEALGVPLIPAHFHPSGATAEAPDISFPAAPPWLPLRGAYHRLTHLAARHGLPQLLAGALSRARAQVGLPRISRAGLWRLAAGQPPLALYAYSPALLAPPSDWPHWRRVTGYWRIGPPPGYAPPDAITRFLAAGEPPVYIGFGSLLAGRDVAAVTRLLVEALRLAGRRGIIYRGTWGDLEAGELPPDVLRIGETPHAWLFPQVAAVVSHGGAGTVAAALAAGRPVTVIPAFGDMQLWGRRVAELGVGAPPIPRSELTAQRLAAAIRAATAPEAAARARDLGARLQGENGAARAAELLEATLNALSGNRAPAMLH